jgi:hypothetical protein
MCPDCRDPKVSDGELVKLSMRKPQFDSGLLQVGCASVKKWQEAGFSGTIFSILDKRGKAGYKNIFASFYFFRSYCKFNHKLEDSKEILKTPTHILEQL